MSKMSKVPGQHRRNSAVRRPHLLTPSEFLHGLFHGVDVVFHGLAQGVGRAWEGVCDHQAKRKLRSRLLAARKMLGREMHQKNPHSPSAARAGNGAALSATTTASKRA